MRFNVRVPASSANLGSGFDTLAVALNLFTELEVETGGDRVEIHGGPDLDGGDNLIAFGMNLAAEAAGETLPSCSIQVASEIPVARGLGSSATALVAGLVTANHLMGRPLPDQEMFELATGIEGHGDNVSASLFGGVTLSLISEHGVLFRRIPVNGDLRVVVFIPDRHALTADARAVVPDVVQRRDAVANLGRCALLVHALSVGDFSVLDEAMRDTLHQPYRSEMFPHVAAMIASAVEAGAYGASLSGAGPSVLSFVDAGRASAVMAALEQVANGMQISGTARLLDIEHEGATVLEPLGHHTTAPYKEVDS